MNTDKNQNESRPLGYWLKAADRYMAAAFAEAFKAEGVGRREWRLLNVIDGTRPARRPLHPGKVARLVELGWVEQNDGEYRLTEEGQNAKDRLAQVVDGLRARVAEAVPEADLETTMRSLEQIATAFGWTEDAPMPRRPRRGGRGGFARGGFGHGLRREYGRGRDHEFGQRHGFGHDRNRGYSHDRGHGHGHVHGRGGGSRRAQVAFERGFAAGFEQGTAR
jgi:hypothetical protein